MILIPFMTAVIGALTASPAQYTAIDIRSQIENFDRKITSLRVIYRIRNVVSGGPPEAFVRCDVACMAPHYLYFELSHNSPNVSWQFDPYVVRIHVTGTQCSVVRPFTRKVDEFEIDFDKPLPKEISIGQYFRATGIWPSNLAIDAKVLRPLRDIAQSNDYANLKPQQELVDGSLCHVLVDPTHREALWWDSTLQMLTKRERYSETGDLVARIEYSDHHWIGESVWLPFVITMTKYDSTADQPINRGRQLSQQLIEVDHAEVNAINPSFFEYRHPPGAIVRGENNVYRQITIGGTELLDEIGRWMNAVTKKAPNGKSAVYSSAMWLAPYVVSLCFVVFFETRIRRHTVSM
jgi:outer membrane lipoprotein-sorting protein